MQELFLIGLTMISLFSIGLSVFAISKLFKVSVEIAAFKASTHTVQYVGANASGAVGVKDSIDDTDITEFQKEYREESRTAYPEFATYDDDLELKGL